ncbi:DUF732 domain-containing protein [Sporichthya polymorpha]|uniref:DUF732 domain-containing protein n=1 Tax=Sporichthya polymorpha TaxID=35751 RepID=UPI00036D4BFC|nr:DUF732 domain-containing protein [Sporichthya polymorpha]
MSLMLEREYAPESELAEKEPLGKTVARVLLLSVVVTALVAGLYMAFGNNGGTDPLAGTPTTQSADKGAKPAPAKPKPPTYAEKVAKAAAALPKPTGMSADAKRTALVKYLNKVGIKVTAASAPATAASQACQFLANGIAPSKMTAEVASGSGFTRPQSKAFLLGASSLYCPGYAKNFR